MAIRKPAQAMPANTLQRVRAVRHFNRFYTRQIGVLQEGLLQSEFSLTEMRVLYELAHRETATATGLCNELGLDAGYLSRIVAGFRKRGLVAARASRADGRATELSLTAKGHAAYAPLGARSDRQVGAMLGSLGEAQQERLLDAMQSIEQLLGGADSGKSTKENPPPQPAYTLRRHRPGDMGWVISRHGALYAEEYGWDETNEGLVAGIAGDFVRNFDSSHERCWIAERGGAPVGCIFLVRKSRTVGQLRMLLIDPGARGLGLGNRLVEECLRFARECGYRKVVLWTNDILHAARHIYLKAGFRLVAEEPHHSFGKDLVGQTWELKL